MENFFFYYVFYYYIISAAVIVIIVICCVLKWMIVSSLSLSSIPFRATSYMPSFHLRLFKNFDKIIKSYFC